LLYDTVAAQLDDKINVFTEFDKYAHASVKRQRRRMKKALSRQALRGPDDWMWQRFSQLEKVGSRVLFVAEKLLNEPTLRLDASFNIFVGMVTETGAVLRTVVGLAVTYVLLAYSYIRYLQLYEPRNYDPGLDTSDIHETVLESLLNGSLSGFVMAAAVVLGLFLGAVHLLAVYQRLRRLFGQHDKKQKKRT
jgi:hypothetical protein